MTRTQLIKGPAVIIRAGHTYFFEGDITLAASTAAYDIRASHVGIAGRHSTGSRITITGKPSGMLDNSAAYFPWNITHIGHQIFGTTDTPLVIHTLAGEKITFKASANHGVRSLHLGTDATALGEITFVCIGELGAPETNANSRYTVEAAAYASTSYDFSKVRTPGYLATYTTDLDSSKPTATTLEGLEGFDISIEPTFEDDIVNRHGLIGQTLTSLTASATFRPANLGETAILDLLRLQGAGACQPGDDIALANSSLVIAPANPLALGITATLYNPGYSEANLLFGFNAQRAGTIRADASLAWTAGTIGNLYTIAFPTFPTPET